MATKDFQQSPSSQPLEVKGDDDAVQPKNQPISYEPQVLQQPINEEEPQEKKERKMFPCRYCNKTFFSPMALGGHQKGHKRERAALKKQDKIQVSYQPYPIYARYPYPIYARYPNYAGVAVNMSPGMSRDSMTYNNPSYLSMESSTSSSNTWRLLSEFYAMMGSKPHPTTAPSAAATSTMTGGVRDFFGDSSASKTTGASGTVNVINLEDEEELDLDLKL